MNHLSWALAPGERCDGSPFSARGQLDPDKKRVPSRHFEGGSTRTPFVTALLVAAALLSAAAGADPVPPSSVLSLVPGSAPAPDLAGPWVAGPAYPTGIVRYGFASVGNDLYVISGVANGTVVTNVRRYNAATNAWTDLPPIPGGSEAPAAAHYAGKIYVVPGTSGATLMYVYDIATNSWSAGIAVPRNFYGAAAGAWNGKAYFVGGYTGSAVATLDIYDIASNTWSTGTPAPGAFFLAGFTQVGQYLYIVGGFTPASPTTNNNQTWRYDMVAGTWSTGPAFTSARADFALAAAGGTLYAMGGDTNGGGYFGATTTLVEELPLAAWPAGSWAASGPALNSGRQANSAGFFSTGRVGGEIWTTGGLDNAFAWTAAHEYTAQCATTSINTVPSWNGSNLVGPFGVPDTATYGQVITAPAGATSLTAFTVYMWVPTTVAFRGEVYAWSAATPGATGPNLYESNTQRTKQGAVFEPVTFNIPGGLAVTPGSQYVIFASTSRDQAIGSGTGPWGFVNGGSNQFVFQNNGGNPAQWTTVPWTTNWGGDLAFTATFCGSGNQAPTITPVASLTVPRGATTNAQIATVFDPDTAPPALTVSATGAPFGIIVANFVLTATAPAGTYNVTADIIAACDAAATGPVNLQVTDGIAAPATGSFTLNTTTNAAGATLTGGATLCAGESTTLSVALTGTGPWSLTWSDGFVQSGIVTSPATRVVSPAVTTTYTITVVSGANGCAGTASGSALVTVNPRPTATVTGGGTVWAGTVSTINVALTGTAPWTLTWNDGTVQIAAASPATRQVSPTFNQTFSVVALSDAKCAGGTSAGSAAFVVKPLPSAVITAASGVCFSSTGNTASVPDGGPGTTYAWAITGGTITSAANTAGITYSAGASGNVVLTVTVTKDSCPNVGTKTIPIQTLPTAPVPAIPANGSTYSGAFVSWTHAGGTWYDVYLDTVNPPEKLIFSGETSNFEAFIPSWVSGVTYYWKVVARNGCGTASSPVQSFIAGSCPWTGAAPTLTSPANGATGVGATATLQWNDLAGAAHYDVYIGTSSGSLTRYDVAHAPENSVAVPVSPGVTYFWKVIVVPVCGSASATVSGTNSFTTAGTPFGATAFSPAFFNRWDSGTVTLSGSGFTAGMQLFTDFHGASAGTLASAVFTNSFSNPTQLQATLTGNPQAPAGRYDVGVTLSGVEEGRLTQAMALRAFTDVTENDYYFLSSARMVDAGIMEPDSSGSTPGPQFSPSTNVTRALMAEYLAKSYQWWRYRNVALPAATCTPSGAGSTDFPDVSCSHPNWLAIHWIKAWGVTQGTPCTQGLCYNPDGNVNRAEMVTFIERLRQTGVLNTLLSTVGEKDPGCAANYPSCKGWADAGGVMDVATWPRREANLAFADRITAGCSGTPGNNLMFCPFDTVTRAQIGEFLARTLGLVPMP